MAFLGSIPQALCELILLLQPKQQKEDASKNIAGRLSDMSIEVFAIKVQEFSDISFD